MSFRAMAWAMDQKIRMAPKIVLLVLANYADKDGVCWPSYEVIKEHAGISSDATLSAALKELCKLHLVSKDSRYQSTQGQVRKTSNRYCLSIPSEFEVTRPMATESEAEITPHSITTENEATEAVTSKNEVNHTSKNEVNHTSKNVVIHTSEIEEKPVIEPIKEPIVPVSSKPTRATGVPQDLKITDRMQEWAAKNDITVNLEQETEQFLDYHQARGSKFKSWEAAWRTWMRNTKRFTAGEKTNSVPSVSDQAYFSNLV